MNVNIRISRFEISRYFVKCVFLTMGSSIGVGLSHLYLELMDAYKERFMPQDGQVAVLKCSPIRKKIRKSFKTLSELKLKFIPQSLETGSYGLQDPLKGSSLKIEILIRLLFFFLNLSTWFCCLKHGWMCHGWVRIFLFFFNFKMRNKW